MNNKFKHLKKGEVPPYNSLFFTWDLTYDCNYTCSYCSLGYEEERARKPKSLIFSPDEWGRIWEDIYQKYGPAHIHLTGGEPFTYPGIMEIIKNFISYHTFECSTNLFWDPDELIPFVPPDRLRIGVSYHPEMEELSVFLKKAEKLVKAGFEVWSNYVAYPPFLENLPQAKKAFKDIGINMSILPFNGRFKDSDYPAAYSEEERDFLRNLGADLPWVKKTMDFAFEEKTIEKEKQKPRKCWMGAVYAKIHPDGKVFRCCAEGAEFLGNITDSTMERLDSPAPCSLENCPCWKGMILGSEDIWE
ncbi:MAG: radical SAM protein, partial [Elusimicrobia bacterium]|nr:radical SAM protein [Elusimicrobiota bacterium]